MIGLQDKQGGRFGKRRVPTRVSKETTEMTTHNCGGELKPARVRVKRSVGNFNLLFVVDGFRCSQCSEEIISRDAALAVEEASSTFKDELGGTVIVSSIPQIVWRDESGTRVASQRTAQSHAKRGATVSLLFGGPGTSTNLR